MDFFLHSNCLSSISSARKVKMYQPCDSQRHVTPRVKGIIKSRLQQNQYQVNKSNFRFKIVYLF